MPNFSPPTYSQAFLPEKDGPNLMRYYDFQVGYSVLIEGGVATPYPGETSPETSRVKAADAAFIGGRTYTITAGQATILTTAGYEITYDSFGAGFNSAEFMVV
jgi:hypothetical protein